MRTMQRQDYPIPASYFDYLDQSASRYGERVALEIFTDEGRKGHTYTELYGMVRAIGSGLIELGVRPGDRVALLDENHPRWGITFLGIWAAGGIAVPLDFRLSDDEVRNLLQFAECRCLLVSGKRLPALRARIDGDAAMRYVVMDGDPPAEGQVRLEDLLRTPAREDVPRRARLADLGTIMFTSGTSADPKGVALTHGALLHHNAGLLRQLDVTADDCILGVLPLHHALALNANFLIPLSVGARVVYLSAVTSQKILAGIREGGATLFACIPQFYYLLHRNILIQVQSQPALARGAFRMLMGVSRWMLRTFGVYAGRRLFPKIHAAFGHQLRLLACGGSYLDPQVIWDLSAMGFRLIQAYGLTESTAALTVTAPWDNVLGSVGKPIPGVEVRILEPNEQGTGEILARCPGLMQGYFRRPDLTAETIRDGWLYTGDLGHLGPDGSLYVTGRKKDVIVPSSGKNIYPDELERHFLQCPFVKEVCVLGIESPDEGPRAEKLHLVAVPDFDYLKAQRIANAGQAIRFELTTLSNRLPSHQRIQSMEIRSEPLPRTTTQKIRRAHLKQEVEAGRSVRRTEGQAAAPAAVMEGPPLSGPHAAAVEKTIRRHKRPAGSLTGGQNLELDLGFDSLERLELLSALEQELGSRVAQDLATRIFTVQDLLDGLAAASSGHAGHANSDASDLKTWSRLLAPAPQDAEYRRPLLDPKPVFARFMFGVMRLLYGLGRVLFRLRVSGRESFPQQPPYLICPNHVSYVDPFFLVACLPFRVFRHIFFVGYSDYFKGPIMSRLARWGNIIPIDADTNLIQALRLGAEGLRQGKVLCIFPEGSRSIDGRLKDFHRGAAILAAEHRAPIVPVGLTGPYEVWPRDTMRIRLHPVTVRVGKPIAPPVVDSAAAYPYEELTAKLREAVSELIEPHQR